MSELERDSFVGPTVAAGFEIERRVNEGWEIDPDRPLTLFGFGTLEVGFLRDPVNTKEPKKSRAEILADARAAKAAKKAASAESTENKEEPKE
jgi:hypothetical protein